MNLSRRSLFGLPSLKMEDQPERFDGGPMSIEEKKQWTAAYGKKLRRNAHRRELYRLKKQAR